MSKYFKLRNIPFILFVVFLISSCANNDTTATSTNTPASTSTPAVTDATPATTTPTLPGTLNKIWIEAAEFNNQNTRLIFSFAIDDEGFLTLYGWHCQGNNPNGNCTGQYDHDPNLKLKQGQASGVGYGPVVFWENVILSKDDVRDIKANIGVGANAYDFVLFVPKNKNGHISYSIILTDRDPTNFSATADLPDFPTGIDANPSPPKNSSN